jgi:hypothetical protein
LPMPCILVNFIAPLGYAPARAMGSRDRAFFLFLFLFLVLFLLQLRGQRREEDQEEE